MARRQGGDVSAKGMVALLFACALGVAEARDPAQRAEFVRHHPCPETAASKPHQSCFGYVVDHIVPLCAGGADAPSNMQWQELAASKVKDKEEWRLCRILKKPPA